MTLDADEFIRRFLLHVLPKGFHRIRHYGLLANGSRSREHRARRASCSPCRHACSRGRATQRSDAAARDCRVPARAAAAA